MFGTYRQEDLPNEIYDTVYNYKIDNGTGCFFNPNTCNGSETSAKTKSNMFTNFNSPDFTLYGDQSNQDSRNTSILMTNNDRSAIGLYKDKYGNQNVISYDPVQMEVYSENNISTLLRMYITVYPNATRQDMKSLLDEFDNQKRFRNIEIVNNSVKDTNLNFIKTRIPFSGGMSYNDLRQQKISQEDFSRSATMSERGMPVRDVWLTKKPINNRPYTSFISNSITNLDITKTDETTPTLFRKTWNPNYNAPKFAINKSLKFHKTNNYNGLFTDDRE